MEESPTDCTMETEPDEHFTDAQVPEIKVLQKFTPQLVSEVSSCGILAVSDQFLAEELITDGVYKRILESDRSNADKVRILLSAVKDAIHTDSSCFETTLSILKALPLCSSKLMLDIETEYQKFTSQGSLKRNCVTSNDQARLRARHLTVTPEIRVIQKFTPKLVSAISSYVPEVSDQCVARGLLSESKHKRLVLTNVCSEDKVRMLLQAMKDSIATDKRCFEIFLGALSKEMPRASRSLLSLIEDEHHKLISMSSAAPMLQQSEEGDKLFIISEQNVLDKLEEAIEKSVLANNEKKRLENQLALKIKEENELKKLKTALETAEGHNREKDEEIKRLKKKLTECKTEIDGLKVKLRKQQETTEEYQMNVKREETIVQEEYKKVIDAHRAATEAEKEMSEKVQLQRNELDELKVKIDKLEQMEMNERKIGELQASIDRLDQKLAPGRLLLVTPRSLLENQL